MSKDPDLQITLFTVIGEAPPNTKPFLGRIWHPRLGTLPIFFSGESEQEVNDKIDAFWEKDRAEREANWKKRDEAKATKKEDAPQPRARQRVPADHNSSS